MTDQQDVVNDQENPIVPEDAPTTSSEEADGAQNVAPMVPSSPQDAPSAGPEASAYAAQTVAGPSYGLPEDVKRRFADVYANLEREIGKVFVGQKELVLGALVALFSGGHVLVESVPGLGKTLFASALGRALGCKFGRIQFTPDLMPSDVIGAPVFNMKTQEFKFHPGPVFAQILLADEINRAPAKTHSALLEAMQEGAATVDGTTHLLPTPFFVIATQNPIESEGTYRLPEAQVDRFMFKLVTDYPVEQDEFKILAEHSQHIDTKDKLLKVQPVLSAEEILAMRKIVNDVYVAPQLLDYINKIVRATRNFPRLAFGASTRAGLALVQGSRTLAVFQGRGFATPDDVAKIVAPALRHRVYLSPEAEIEGRDVDEILAALVRSIDVPRM